jgi:two-component system chemotaxis response regulator CheY
MREVAMMYAGTEQIFCARPYRFMLGHMNKTSATILVVGENPVVQRMYSYILRKTGHHVIRCDDGHTALKLLSTCAIELIITDLEMPAMSGLELLRQIRMQVEYTDLPVVMITDSEYEQDRRNAEAEGISMFLTRPISSHEFLDTIHQQLDLVQYARKCKMVNGPPLQSE